MRFINVLLTYLLTYLLTSIPSGPPHPFTIIQHRPIRCIKQKNTIYTNINTNESTHSEMGPVRQNPI